LDTFGRLQTLTYPDAEVLTYQYDSGGLPRRASGQKGGFTYPYVTRLEYDKFEQRAFVEDGNAVRTQYSYRPDNRRLDSLSAGKTGATRFPNLKYNYDRVGNVVRLANNVPVGGPSTFGGPTEETFTYDDVYRPTGSAGTYQFAPSKTNTYSMDLSYDSVHKHPVQDADPVQLSAVPVTQRKTTYDLAYAYQGAHPHAPTHIGDRTFTYDTNGNQTGWTNDENGTRRTIVWDDDNCVRSIFDNGHEKTYTYDDEGQRVVKRGPQGETVYANQYFTMRNGAIGTKHIYAGTVRMVSKLAKTNVFEEDQFFYHPDHLGSSSYVTDLSGALYEHVEYFPFGETRVEEKSNTQRTPYLFTGKELDEETDYYGARYYDPRTSVWQNPDPILEKYLPGRSKADADLRNGWGIQVAESRPVHV
jgi:RHS repeat-associated protein